jgi:glucose-6-phosphate 1-dehydrogenase
MDAAESETRTAFTRPAPAGPCGMAIFGAGDLVRRLLFPALYNLAAERLLPEHFAIVVVARPESSDDRIRQDLREALNTFATRPVDPETAEWLLKRVSYMSGDFGDPESYRRLDEHLHEAGRTWRVGGNWLFYLATPPSVFGLVAQRLGQANLLHQRQHGGWRRIVIEKPFGTDYDSARALNQELLQVASEDQIFRIDHYLGKETVQNIMVMRFANGLFEPLWNRDHIDHVQITVAETVGVEARGRFYEPTGALRDMVPNHLFQLLSLTAMEPPTCFGADAVRTEKSKVLEAVHRLSPEDVRTDVVRGQYGAGTVKDKAVPAYREAEGVASDSATETFVALKLTIDNWRWAGVPFYLRTGKALAARATEIAVNFKRAPFLLFRDTPVEHLAQNFLVLRIQPNEGISLHFNAKVPGPNVNIDGVRMDFAYKDYFDSAPNTGYETLIYDCMIGDPTLFQRADGIEAGWRVVQPVLDAWRDGPPPSDFPNYTAGSWGPKAADDLLERDGRHWRAPGAGHKPQ